MLKTQRFNRFSAFVISLVLLALTITGTFLISLRQEVVVTEKRLNRLPYTIDKWTGEEYKFIAAVYAMLDTDDNLFRYYNSANNNPLWLYIGYYGSKKGGITFHLPNLCYPGTGWIILNVGKVDIPWHSRNTTVRVNKMLVKKENQQEIVLYWLHSAGNKVLDFGPRLKINRLWDKIYSNRFDGAFVRISAPISNGDTEDTIEYEKEFASHLLEYLPDCWPIEENAKDARN